jgi:PhnB protein
MAISAILTPETGKRREVCAGLGVKTRPDRRPAKPRSEERCEMLLNAYVSFNGSCESAFKFYEKVLDGKIVAMMTYGQTPMKDQMPAESHGQVVHARMTVGDQVLMGSDAPPGRYEPTKGTSLILSIDQPAEAERVFKALSENGSVSMPIAETFWAQRFGMLTDQFGIPWMINCERAHG